VRPVECCREQELTDALASGQWPERADTTLREHVSSCAICADVVEVFSAFMDEGRQFATEARIPSSAVMWWRAQMRARQEAAREAARPIAVAQVVGGVTALVVGVAVLVALSPWLSSAVGDLFAGLSFSAPFLSATDSSQVSGWVALSLVMALGLCLLLAPVALYVALSKD
jgi:hypothetical protein